MKELSEMRFDKTCKKTTQYGIDLHVHSDLYTQINWSKVNEKCWTRNKNESYFSSEDNQKKSCADTRWMNAYVKENSDGIILVDLDVIESSWLLWFWHCMRWCKQHQQWKPRRNGETEMENHHDDAEV